MSKIEVKKVYKSFFNSGDTVDIADTADTVDIADTAGYLSADEKSISVLEDINLKINEGEFVCLLGPSGCGKSTLLHLMAGFDAPTLGEIMIDDAPVKGPNSKYITIFQNYGLFPWRNVLRNVEYGLEIKGVNKEDRVEVAKKQLKTVNLWQFRDRFPVELSGGMKQRVNLARALAVDPEVIFMDEPFGALDAITRIKMQEEIIKIRGNNNKTIVFVTHEIDEAIFLADRVIIMSADQGKIQKEIKVKLVRPRDRTNPDFIKIRDEVYKELKLSEETGMLQYYI